MDRPKDAAQAVSIVRCIFQCNKIAVELTKSLVTLDKKFFDHVVKFILGSAPLMRDWSLSLGNSALAGQSAYLCQFDSRVCGEEFDVVRLARAESPNAGIRWPWGGAYLVVSLSCCGATVSGEVHSADTRCAKSLPRFLMKEDTRAGRVYPSRADMSFSGASTWSIQTTALQSARGCFRRVRRNGILQPEFCITRYQRQPDAAS